MSATNVDRGVTVADLGGRLPYHHPGLPFVLLWSEKAGCTSLLRWFLHHTGELVEADAYDPWVHRWEIEVMKVRPGYADAAADAIAGGAPVIKLVRHPFDRAVSSFLTLSRHPEGADHFGVTVRRRVREWLYGDGDAPYGFGFVEYLRWLDTVDVESLDPHLAPQRTTLEDSIADLELIRLDGFADGVRSLEERFGLDPAPLDEITSSRHHTTRLAVPAARRSAVVHLHPPIPRPDDWPVPSTEDFVDDESADLVARLFRIDHEAYGFEPRRPGGAPGAGGDDLAPHDSSAPTLRYEAEVDPERDNDPFAFALQMVGHDRRVLELGCAGGHVTRALVERGNTVVGVEFDPADAELARPHTERLHLLDLDRDLVSDHESSGFDVLLAGDVLEHLRDPARTLVDSLSLVAPGGDVVISVPHLAHADVRLHLLEGRVEYADGGLLDRTHLRWLTRASLHDLLADAGLVGVELRRVTRPLGSTRIGVTPGAHSDAVLDFIRSDPDHDVFQFVVRARRRHELPAGFDPRADDALAPVTHEWPHHDCDEVDELRRYAHDLRTALDAWENSRTARVIGAAGRVAGRMRPG